MGRAERTPDRCARTVEIELAAMARAIDGATGDVGYGAPRVRACRREPAEVTAAGLCDDNIAEHHAATDGNIAGRHGCTRSLHSWATAAAGRRRRASSAEQSATGGQGGCNTHTGDNRTTRKRHLVDPQALLLVEFVGLHGGISLSGLGSRGIDHCGSLNGSNAGHTRLVQCATPGRLCPADACETLHRARSVRLADGISVAEVGDKISATHQQWSGAEPRRVPATGGIIQLGGSSTQMKRCPYKNVDPGPGPQDRPSAPGSAQTDGRGRAATATVL